MKDKKLQKPHDGVFLYQVTDNLNSWLGYSFVTALRSLRKTTATATRTASLLNASLRYLWHKKEELFEVVRGMK